MKPGYKKFISFLIPSSLLAIVMAIRSIWGPLSPTGPEMHPNGQASDPLTAPFYIENKSAFFSIHIHSVACSILGPFSNDIGGKIIGPIIFHFRFDIKIPANSPPVPWSCPLSLSNYRMTPFSVCFVIQYEPSAMEFWKREDILYATNIFAWQNGVWKERADVRRTDTGTLEVDESPCKPTMLSPFWGFDRIPPQAVAPPALASPRIGPAETPGTAPMPSPETGTGYRALLMAWLESHKRYPVAARQRGEEGQAVLRFEVDRSGRVIDYAIAKSSGYPDLDASIEEMMQGATLPPFPAAMTQDQIEVSVTIRFNLARWKGQ